MLSAAGGEERTAPPWAGLLVALALGSIAYANLVTLAGKVVIWLGLDQGSSLGEALQFFLYEVPKILLLLYGIVFLVGVAQSFFPPARTGALLGGRRAGVGNVMAAGLGIVTPFCSCSAVPLFIGFLSAGVPLGVTFSFLVSAPMVNEVALALLLALFGWKVAALYLGLGLLVAIASGLVMGGLRMEDQLEDWVKQAATASGGEYQRLVWGHRV